MSEGNVVNEDFQVVVSIDVQGTNWADIEIKARHKADDFFGNETPVEVVVWRVIELMRNVPRDDDDGPWHGSFEPPIYQANVYASRSLSAAVEHAEHAFYL